jgi:hypothetical protein
MPLKAVPGAEPVEVEGGLELEVTTGATEQPVRRREDHNNTTARELDTRRTPSR